MRSIVTLVATVLALSASARAIIAAEAPAAKKTAPPAKVLTKRQAGSDWPSFLGPTGDSKSTEKGILTKWPEHGPPLVWQMKLGTGYCAPAVSQGRLFQFDRQGDKARLRVVESETGKPLWTFEYPTDYQDIIGYDNGPRAAPLVDRDRVYIFGPEGMLHCLSVIDGRVIWKLDTMAAFDVVQNFFGVGSVPVIEGDLLITPIGGSPPESKLVPPGQLNQVVGKDSGIVAFDKMTGKVKYKITSELASYASPVLATINGRRWCFHFARGGLVGFDPATGKVDFEFPWKAPIQESVNAANPVVVGDLVFISETYGMAQGAALLKVRPGGYDVVWSDADRRRDKAMQTHWNTPIHVGGYLYGSSGRHTENAELRCIELKTGKVMWSVPDLTRASLMLVDGHFICLSEDGMLRLLKVSPEKYTEVAKVMLEDLDEPNHEDFPPSHLLKPPAWAAPILSHGLLYVRGRDRLVCLELIPDRATTGVKRSK